MSNPCLRIQGIVSDKSRKLILEVLEDVREERPSYTEFPILSRLFRGFGNNFSSPIYSRRPLDRLGYVTKKDFPYSEFLFFSYSSFDIAKGTIFSHFYEEDNLQNRTPIFCKIGMVTQQFALPYDAIPFGHKTLCQVIFDKDSYELIHSKIPTVNNWTVFKQNFTISI